MLDRNKSRRQDLPLTDAYRTTVSIAIVWWSIEMAYYTGVIIQLSKIIGNALERRGLDCPVHNNFR